MKVYITICCKEKTTLKGKIPSIERYISNRINSVYSKSQLDNVNFYILSGKYGLLSPEDKIDWYDKLLESSEVEKMTAIVSKQIADNNISEIVFFSNSDWINYNKVISQSCDLVSLIETNDF